MVYHGPSKGCRLCRKRRVKCDQGKPACNNCTRRKVECPGYESTFDYRHRNETNSTILRAQQKGDTSRRKSAASDATFSEFAVDYHSNNFNGYDTSPYSNDMAVALSHPNTPESGFIQVRPTLDVLSPDPESFVLNWYFQNYPMRTIDPQAQRGFMSLLKPVYLSSSSDSPLRPAVAAVASNLLMLYCHQGSDTDLARKFYAQSVSRMQTLIADPVKSKQDDLLLTALALNFYDTVNLRWSPEHSNERNHRLGALALVKHRGSKNGDSEISRHVTSSLRTALCHWALESDIHVSPDVLQWMNNSCIPTNKTSEMDVVTLKLVGFQNRVRNLYKFRGDDDDVLDQTAVDDMIEEGLAIDEAFNKWHDTCPSHWKPHYVSADEVIPSLREVAFWGDRCAVYWDLSVCDVFNIWRIRRLLLLRLIRQLCIASFEEKSKDILSSVNSTMQQLIDDSCEALPFMVGDLNEPLEHHRMYDITYPSFNNGITVYPNPDNDHQRSAAASGAWFASALFVSLMKLAIRDSFLDPFPVKKAQFDWIVGQLGRLQNVFLLSQPKHRSTWKSARDFGTNS